MGVSKKSQMNPDWYLVLCMLKIHSHVERRKQEMRAAAGLKVDGDRRISLVS